MHAVLHASPCIQGAGSHSRIQSKSQTSAHSISDVSAAASTVSPPATPVPLPSVHSGKAGQAEAALLNESASDSGLGRELEQKQLEFANRRRAIDAQFRQRLDSNGAGPSMVGGGRSGTVQRSDDENVAPNFSHAANKQRVVKAGGEAGEGTGSVLPSPGPHNRVTEHQQEMLSLHDEIEALQSRILSRLEPNTHGLD